MEHGEQNRRLEQLNRSAVKDSMQFSLTFSRDPVNGWMWAVAETSTLTGDTQDIWRANTPIAAIEFAERALSKRESLTAKQAMVSMRSGKAIGNINNVTHYRIIEPGTDEVYYKDFNRGDNWVPLRMGIGGGGWCEII